MSWVESIVECRKLAVVICQNIDIVHRRRGCREVGIVALGHLSLMLIALKLLLLMVLRQLVVLRLLLCILLVLLVLWHLQPMLLLLNVAMQWWRLLLVLLHICLLRGLLLAVRILILLAVVTGLPRGHLARVRHCWQVIRSVGMPTFKCQCLGQAPAG